jgi:hypothetical protein
MWDMFEAQFMDLIYALQTVQAWLINAMNWVLIEFWGAFVTLWNWAVEFGGWILGAIRTVAGGIWRALQALAHLNFSAIWQALKRAYNRVMRTIAWLRRRIMEPLDRYRRLILDLYNRFWKPVIRFLDSLRVFIRIIGIFNRRLAAQLDAALWRLEARILSPIAAALRRINALSSQISAYFTVLGYLDRTLLLESLRRDALLVWEVLTNPRGAIHTTRQPFASYTYSDLHNDMQVYAKTHGGPIADYIDEAHRSVREDLLGVI